MTALTVAAALTAGILLIVAAIAKVRWAIAIPVAVGAAAGVFVGGAIVVAACRPGTCAPAAGVAAFFTGIGALVGVGLVVSLVDRSFTEYREAVAANRPPPQPGCEADPGDGDLG